MPRITIVELQKKVTTLESINSMQSTEINRLHEEIARLKDTEQVVSREEYNSLLKQLEDAENVKERYKTLFTELKNKQSAETKLNARNAGRKAYGNKEVIAMIYELYLSGRSLQEIAETLNSAEIKTARNREWAKSSVRFILLNEKNVENGYISEDTFNSAVKLLHAKK